MGHNAVNPMKTETAYNIKISLSLRYYCHTVMSVKTKSDLKQKFSPAPYDSELAGFDTLNKHNNLLQ